jgi:carbonic anhydrase
MPLFKLAALVVLALPLGAIHADPPPLSDIQAQHSDPLASNESPPRTKSPAADVALRELVRGNKRFIRGESIHPHESAAYRLSVVDEQRPVAVVLTCSDSRVKPSLVFDQGFGDLFVVMVAGGVVGEDVAGSVEYAVEHLGTSLVIVMGHQNCGAVSAAYHSYVAHDLPDREPHEIETLLMRIEPAMQDLDASLPAADQIDAAIRKNTNLSVEQLLRYPALQKAVDAGRVEIRGAYYDLATGQVTLQSE